MIISTFEEKVENKELEKRLLAAEMFKAEKNTREIAKTISSSRQTVLNWKKIWKLAGVDGLKAIRGSGRRVCSRTSTMKMTAVPMPVKLYDLIQKSAKLNRRSLSGELLFRLETDAKKEGYEAEEE